jgi:NADH-quinone oxidoreductase subunit L
MNSLPLWLIPLAPVLAAFLAGVLALTRRAEKAAPLLTIAATALSGITALGWIPQEGGQVGRLSFEWLKIGANFKINLGVYLDPLAWMMVAVVCVVSLLVQIYSVGYMKGENGFARYFAYLGLFTASMLGLVVADNLFQLYVCWELVGICSYLLIGFWWQKPSAASAAKKAFVVTRFGDVGFLLGVLLLAAVAGSFQFDTAMQAVARVQAGELTTVPLVGAQVFLWLAPLLLFCGAVGKSAQFPLHIWLPDAMEGPTPVSALIHAATMVAAGVYMVARLLPVFAAVPFVTEIVLLTGAVTALIAATIALVQTDIKKVMAYSTISQLGYMMLGLGAGSLDAGMFHLVTHAMFKALLFLAAGSVIHAMHHAANPNDLRIMGGLGSRMRITAVTCGIGVLALAGFPGLSGFWSKDAILGAALDNGSPVALFGLAVGILVAGLTAFYSTRMWMLAFAGSPRSGDAEHTHESPAVMTIPLIALAIPSIALGAWLHMGHRFTHFLHGAPAHAEPMHLWLVAVTILTAVGGIGLGYILYRAPSAQADPVERIPGYALFANLWYMDAFWSRGVASSMLALGKFVAWFDRTVIDGAVNLTGWVCYLGGRELRRASNGQAQTYTAAALLALVIAALVLLLFHNRTPNEARSYSSSSTVISAEGAPFNHTTDARLHTTHFDTGQR